MSDFRHISWPEYGELVEALAAKVHSGGRSFDLVVGIARGGIPVAMVIADRLGVSIDFINVKSYSGIAERSLPRILSTLTDSVKSKSLLLVDDLVDHGDTMAMVQKYLLDMNPLRVETAVIFKKPWSTIEPDYYLEVDDRWIVFPFELGEVERLRNAKGGVQPGKTGRARV